MCRGFCQRKGENQENSVVITGELSRLSGDSADSSRSVFRVGVFHDVSVTRMLEKNVDLSWRGVLCCYLRQVCHISA